MTQKAISRQVYTLYIHREINEREKMRKLLLQFANRKRRFTPADLI